MLSPSLKQGENTCTERKRASSAQAKLPWRAGTAAGTAADPHPPGPRPAPGPGCGAARGAERPPSPPARLSPAF